MYCELNMLPHAIFSWSDAYETFEVFAEEGGVGEVEFFCDAGNGLVGVHEFHFDTGDEGAVNPFFGGDTAGLTDYGAKIAVGEAEAIGIIADLVLFGTVLIDELNKPVENGLLTRLGGL